MERKALNVLLVLATLVIVLAGLNAGHTALAADADADGVPDSIDLCPNTTIPEPVPTQRLGVNRFALRDSDAIFDTAPPSGTGFVASQFTLSDTRGCSCSQIIEQLDLGAGHTKFGCSIGAMQVFVAQFQNEPQPTTLQLLATGQTTPFPADKNDGIAGPVSVPDDGTLQLGAPLHYVDNGDGTVTDVNTGLMWEKKCDTCAETDLHRVNFTSNNPLLWSGNGSQDTIWDWLDRVNAEGGTGFAGFSDWRIPNIRELLSIVHYGRTSSPLIDPIFGPTRPDRYWSSTTRSGGIWVVIFSTSEVDLDPPFVDDVNVRAVRGGR